MSKKAERREIRRIKEMGVVPESNENWEVVKFESLERLMKDLHDLHRENRK